MILSLMEKGLVPGTELEVIKKDLGLYYLRIDDGSFVIRKPEAEKFNIEVE
jgi:Fe2+ transport system protein FeoA